MLLIKAAKFIICTYILFIISYVELILSESLRKFQCSLILYGKLTVITCQNVTFNIIKFTYIFSNLGPWHANKVVYLQW